jgi:hypothetical protein
MNTKLGNNKDNKTQPKSDVKPENKQGKPGTHGRPGNKNNFHGSKGGRTNERKDDVFDEIPSKNDIE